MMSNEAAVIVAKYTDMFVIQGRNLCFRSFRMFSPSIAYED